MIAVASPEVGGIPYPPSTRAEKRRLDLDIVAIRRSRSWLLARSGELRGVILLLLVESWSQIPCGTLPASKTEIASLAGVDAEVLDRNNSAVLADWNLGSDGRLYHPLLVELVLDIIRKRNREYRKHRDAVIARHGNACFYCRATDCEITLDHVVAQSAGGSHDEDNLVPACRPCNSKKGAKAVAEWMH